MYSKMYSKLFIALVFTSVKVQATKQVLTLQELAAQSFIQQGSVEIQYLPAYLKSAFKTDSEQLTPTISQVLVSALIDMYTDQLDRLFVETVVNQADIQLAVPISQGGDYIVTRCGDKTAKVWSLETGQLMHILIGHDDLVLAVAISQDGKFVLTGSWDKTAKVWDTQTGQLLHTLTGHGNWISSLVVSKDNKYIVTGSYDKTAKVWCLETGRLLHTLVGHSRWISSVTISLDGKYILTRSGDNTIKIWDVSYVTKTIELAKLLEVIGQNIPVQLSNKRGSKCGSECCLII